MAGRITRVGAWLWNILVWLDQGVNVIAGPLFNAALNPQFRFGFPDETLSSVFGKNAYAGNCRFCVLFCWLLDKVDKHHCKKNIEEDEGTQPQP